MAPFIHMYGRALEYTLYDKELRRAREALDELEHARSDDAEAGAELHEAARATADSIASITRQMKQSTALLNRTTADLASLEAELTASVTRQAKLELEVSELKTQAGADADTQKKTEQELKKVDAAIEKAKKSLHDVAGPAYDAARKEVSEVVAKKDNTFEQVR